jgi:hypothetical protein
MQMEQSRPESCQSETQKTQTSGQKQLLSQEQEMIESLKPVVNAMLSRWILAEDDAAWKQWVDYKSREKWDLLNLLRSDVRESMKNRALFLLFVPWAELSPIYWPKEEYRMIDCIEPDFLKEQSPQSLKFVCRMLETFVLALAPLHSPQPGNLVAQGDGIAMFMSVPDEYHNALFFYNQCIMVLLPLVPEEQGEKIFPLFSLNDISAYWDMEGSSGYNPFQHLLCYAPDIDERWKWEADARMRKIILDELSGRTRAREDYERALGCYGHIIQLQLWDREGKLYYPVELLASQLEFIVDHQPADKDYIEDYHVAKMLDLLSDEKYEQLRHKLARAVVFEEEGIFSKPYQDNAMYELGANMMISQFGETDPELRSKLEWFIEEGKKEAETKKEEKCEKTGEEKILAQMN